MLEPEGKHTLEELLRARRQQKPDQKFWDGFDRELKAKQRQHIQRELVKETRIVSTPQRSLLKFGSFATAAGLAAFAVVFSLRDGGPQGADATAPLAKSPEPAANFQVAVQQAETQSAGLNEFATMAQTVAPRIIVQDTVPPTVSEPAPSALAAVETEGRQMKVVDELMADFGFSIASSASLSGSETIEVTDNYEIDTRIAGFDRSLALGKYADPLKGDFTRSFDPVNTQPVSTSSSRRASFSELEDVLSSQSNRRAKSIDAVTLKF